jgi:hypothetical protein
MYKAPISRSPDIVLHSVTLIIEQNRDCNWRGAMSFEIRHTRARSDSLFCTPPPDKRVVNELLAVDLRQAWAGSDVGEELERTATESSDPLFQKLTSPQAVHRRTDNHTESEGSRQLFMCSQKPGLLYGKEDARKSTIARRRDQQYTASRGDSLTTTDKTSSASTAAVGNHLTAYSPTPSCSSTTPSLPAHDSTASTHYASDVPYAKLSTVRLISYPSTEDETETPQVRASETRKTRTRKKQETNKYKSAEFVECESDGSNADISDHQQQPRKGLPQKLKRTKPTGATTTSTTSDKMRINDYSWGATSSSKKRPLPPTSPPAAAKRLKQGPFLEHSSEDDSGRDDDDGYNFDGHIAAAPERPLRRGVTHDLPLHVPENDTLFADSPQQQGTNRPSELRASASKTPTSQPSKALNMKTLLSMLAKKHGGSVPTRLTRSPSLETSTKKTPNAAQANTVQQDTQSPSPRTTPAMSHARTSGRGKNSGSNVDSLEVRRLTQKSEPSRGKDKQVRTQHGQLRAFDSTTLRKADTGRPQTVANSNSLRSLLNTQKTVRHGAAQEPDDMGSDCRRAQAGRELSSDPAKDTQRPGVSARYGHTLGARKINSQEKGNASPKEAPAAISGKVAQRAVSANDVASSTVAQVRAGKQTQTSVSKAPLTSNTALSLSWASEGESTQPDSIPRLAKRPIPRTPLPLASSNAAKLAEGAPARQKKEATRRDVADETRQRPYSFSSTKHTTLGAHDKIAAQEKVASTVTRSTSDQEVLSTSSTVHTRHDTTQTRKQQADQSRNATNHASKHTSFRARPTQEAGIQGPCPSSIHSNSRGEPKGMDSLNYL